MGVRRWPRGSDRREGHVEGEAEGVLGSAAAAVLVGAVRRGYDRRVRMMGEWIMACVVVIVVSLLVWAAYGISLVM